MTYMILIANSIVKQSKRQKAGKLYLWILITTYYLLSKNWDIFATRCCILLIFNHNYFRGGEVRADKKRQVNHKKTRINSEFVRVYIFFTPMIFYRCYITAMTIVLLPLTALSVRVSGQGPLRKTSL